jgi:hypothetical protein
VEAALDLPLRINWCYFSIAQINHPDKEQWKVWEQSADVEGERYVAGLRSFWAAEAARRQGEDAFRRFHDALLYARHVEGRDLADRQTQRDVARQVELNLDQFERDWGDRTLLERLKADHTRAVSESNIFGTPSFVFPGAEALYLKLSKVPEGEEALATWHSFYNVTAQMPWVVEMKRPG